MEPDRCRELDVGVRSLRLSVDNGAFKAWLDGLGAVENCIADGLRRCCEGEDWLGFEQYVIAAFQRPSRSYTTVLCEVLSRRDLNINHEDIVDALAEIRDPVTVDCLRDTLSWEPEWDEFRNLAVKCIWALAAIGTPDAVAAIRDAATGDAFEVREAAAHELMRLGG